MKTTVTIEKKENSIKLTNSSGVEWTFPEKMKYSHAIVLLLSETLDNWCDILTEDNKTFTMELNIESND